MVEQASNQASINNASISVQDGMAGQETLRLKRAILLYENGQSAMATVHDVAGTDPDACEEARPEIRPGRCLTQPALAELVRRMSGLSTRRSLLPAGMLTYDGGRMAWWSPPRRAPIFFQTRDKAFNEDAGGKIALHPPLLFVAEPGDLYVFALAKPTRPDAGTKLCRAPYFNVWDRGHMCAGNVALPEQVLPEEIALWEKAFFETNFTHSNAGKEALLKKPHTHEAFWRMLTAPPAGVPEGNFTVNWADYLAPLDLTVDQVINMGETE